MLFKNLKFYLNLVQNLLDLEIARISRRELLISSSSILYCESLSGLFCLFVFWFKAATQLARWVQLKRTQVVCSNKVGQSRLAQRHSRNGPRTCEYSFDIYSQSHLGWHFRKLKAQSSNTSFATFQWKETFDLWALSFETALENVTPSGIGCTSTHFFWSRHSHTQTYKQLSKRTKHKWTITELFWIGMNVCLIYFIVYVDYFHVILFSVIFLFCH
jgi:hypothetical protein